MYYLICTLYHLQTVGTYKLHFTLNEFKNSHSSSRNTQLSKSQEPLLVGLQVAFSYNICPLFYHGKCKYGMYMYCCRLGPSLTSKLYGAVVVLLPVSVESHGNQKLHYHSRGKNIWKIAESLFQESARGFQGQE